LNGIPSSVAEATKGYAVWGGLLTFLGGPRGCIGYRFSLLELKAILATLIDTFEFAERDVGGTPIEGHSQLVTRPYVTGELEKGSQMPLRIRLAV